VGSFTVRELVLKHFFGGSVEEWQTHRRQKEASIRRLAHRPDCPLGKSALSEAVAIYVAKDGLPASVDDLTPSHVAVALRFPPAERLSLIEKAVTGAWTVREMRREALLLKRSAGERRGRPRHSPTRAALSQLRASLDALDTGLELLRAAVAADTETMDLLEKALAAFEPKLIGVRARLDALAGPGLKSSPTSSVVVPQKGRLAG
jgi:hypothetical protein